MTMGFQLRDSNGNLNLDSSDRIFKFISSTTYIGYPGVGYNWLYSGLTAVTDTSRNNEYTTYSVFDLDVTSYITNDTNIIGIIPVAVSHFYLVYVGVPSQTARMTNDSFTILNGNTLRIYLGGFPDIYPSGDTTSAGYFTLDLYEY
jgi:hypothetical protein